MLGKGLADLDAAALLRVPHGLLVLQRLDFCISSGLSLWSVRGFGALGVVLVDFRPSLTTDPNIQDTANQGPKKPSLLGLLMM